MQVNDLDELVNGPGPHTIFHLYVSDYHWLVWRYFWHIAFRLAVFCCCCGVLNNFLPHEAWVLEKTSRLGWSRRYVCAAYQGLVDLVAGFALNWRAKVPSLDLELMGFRPRRTHRHYGWYDRNVKAAKTTRKQAEVPRGHLGQ